MTDQTPAAPVEPAAPASAGEVVRPHYRFPFGGNDYEWRGHVGGADGLLLHQHAGIKGPADLYAGILSGHTAALIALVFLAKRQAGERITWDVLLAQFEGDDDLWAFPQRISNAARDQAADAGDADGQGDDDQGEGR